MSSLLTLLMAMGGLMGDAVKLTEAEKRVSGASHTAILEEYELIKEKKSQLPRRYRDLVEHRAKQILAAQSKRNKQQRPVHLPGKGDYNGLCNRESCQKPPAIFFNQSTEKYYCPQCAKMINEMNPESYKLYGTQLCIIKKP